MSMTTPVPSHRTITRRRLLAAFMTLAAYLRLMRLATAETRDRPDETVLRGRWLLKRSDLP